MRKFIGVLSVIAVLCSVVGSDAAWREKATFGSVKVERNLVVEGTVTAKTFAVVGNIVQTGNQTITGDQSVTGTQTLTGSQSVSGNSAVSGAIIADSTTASTLTNGSVVTLSRSFTRLDTGLSGITATVANVSATLGDGALLWIVNTGTNVIVLADSAPLYLSGAITLTGDDTLGLIAVSTNKLVQIGTSAN